MDEWIKKTRIQLRKHGYEPQSIERAERGYENTVVKAKCTSKELAVKWYESSDYNKFPIIGDDINRFIGGWYVQKQMNSLADIPTPNVLLANFKEENYFYVMEGVEFTYADDLWSNDMYLMRVCQEVGKYLSEIHQISNSDIGGIPSQKGNVMENMRRYITDIENRISETAYVSYLDILKQLRKRYEQIFNPQKTKNIIHGNPVAANILTSENGIVKAIVDWDDAMYADPLLDIAIYQSMVCDVFGIFSPWDIKNLRDTVIESYKMAVNRERLDILRCLVHLRSLVIISSESMLSPWERVAGRSEMTRRELHQLRFENLKDRIEFVD